MTSRVQEQRLSATATKPPNGARPPGELWLNLPDFRLGMIDPTQVAVDLLAVRYYAATSTYISGDYVTHAGDLLRAKTNLTPHAFAATDWDLIPTQTLNDARYYTQTASDARYYTKTYIDANFYTKGFIDLTFYTRTQSDARYYTQTQSDARYLQLTGGSLSGELTVGGNGVHYTRTGGYNHATAFGWDGTPMMWVDNTFVGYLATQAYVAAVAASYLPLAGGTITGSLMVNGNETVGGTLQNSNGRLITYAPNYGPTVTLWRGDVGAMGFYYDGAIHWGQMGGDGSFLADRGYFDNAGNIVANARIIASTGIFANTGQDFGLFQLSQYRIVQYAGNWGLWWDTTNGNLFYNSPSGIRFIVDGGGNGTFAGGLQVNGSIYTPNTVTGGYLHSTGNIDADATVNAGGDVTAANNVHANGTVMSANSVRASNDWDFGFGNYGGNRRYTYNPDWFWEWIGSNGDLEWHNPGVMHIRFQAGDGYIYNARGGMYGNGPYFNFSDERLKADPTPATVGLNEVLQIVPITFTRTGQDEIEIGFSAQQVQAIIPEAVRGDPFLAVTIDPLVAALVNATKTLDARISALEARRP